MNYSKRVQQIEPSATVAVGNLAAELRADGVDVADLSVGEPDFGTPENIVRAGQEAMDNGHTGYPPSNGIPGLRKAIVEKLERDGMAYDFDSVIVTPGAKQALFETVQSLVDPGDEVVLLDPAWVSYRPMISMAGGSVTSVDTRPYEFQLAPALDELAETIDDDTELLVINSPSNPTGSVYTERALEGVRDLAVDHGVTVLSDEIYDGITYGTEPTSIGAIDGMADRTVTVNGFSKTYAMTGWRLGYLAGPEGLVTQASKVHSHSVTCAANFVQHAGIEALENSNDEVEQMVDEFRKRRDLLVDLLEANGISIRPPDGAFYAMVPVDDDDQTWCENALEDAHVATVPGSAFGAPGYARFAYTCSQDRLREAIDRLAENELL